ncbi:MAG TPA: hypothetical protein VMV46_09575 [Thermoanaerobaculia bacterium]|nr:hypothetical protein [Thermoanaerobaculia bacterium]
MTGRLATSRRWIFAVVYGATVLAMTVPIVPRVWAGSPLILGLPPSILWVALWLAVTFALVWWLYRTEPTDGRAERRGR